MAGIFGSSRAHLEQARESYWAHLRFAGAVGSMMMAAGLACCVHAVVPGVCRDTASRTLRCLGGVIEDRSSLDRAAVETAEAVAFAFLLAMAAAVGASLWVVGAGALIALFFTAVALASRWPCWRPAPTSPASLPSRAPRPRGDPDASGAAFSRRRPFPLQSSAQMVSSTPATKLTEAPKPQAIARIRNMSASELITHNTIERKTKVANHLHVKLSVLILPPGAPEGHIAGRRPLLQPRGPQTPSD